MRIDPSMPVNFDHAQHWLISGFVVATHLASRREGCPQDAAPVLRTGQSAGTESQRSHRGASTDTSVDGKLLPIFGSMFATRTVSSKRNGAPGCGWRIMNVRRRSLEKTKQTENSQGEDPRTSERNTSAKGPKHGWVKEQRSGHDFVWMIFEVHKRKMWCVIRNTQGDKGSL